MNNTRPPACCGACGLGGCFGVCPLSHYAYWLLRGQAVSGYQLVPLSLSLRDFKGPLWTNGSSVSGRYKHAEETQAPWKFWLETPSLTSLVANDVRTESCLAALVANSGECVPFAPSPCQHKKLRLSLDCSLTWTLATKRGPLTLPGFSELLPALALDTLPPWLLTSSLRDTKLGEPVADPPRASTDMSPAVKAGGEGTAISFSLVGRFWKSCSFYLLYREKVAPCRLPTSAMYRRSCLSILFRRIGEKHCLQGARVLCPSNCWVYIYTNALLNSTTFPPIYLTGSSRPLCRQLISCQFVTKK